MKELNYFPELLSLPQSLWAPFPHFYLMSALLIWLCETLEDNLCGNIWQVAKKYHWYPDVEGKEPH